MIPPFAINLAAKYGAILLLFISLVAGYYYWKHQVFEEAMSECNESKEQFRIEAEHFKLARLEEVDKINAANDERLKNAIQTYIDHYESQRNTPVATSLRVKTNTSSACSSSVPGANQDQSERPKGVVAVGEAELPARNLQQLNSVIADIERMELLCEKILNTVE